MSSIFRLNLFDLQHSKINEVISILGRVLAGVKNSQFVVVASP